MEKPEKDLAPVADCSGRESDAAGRALKLTRCGQMRCGCSCSGRRPRRPNTRAGDGAM